MAEATVSTKPDTIVFIHGLWTTPRAGSTGSSGTRIMATRHAPAWPGFEVEVEALNADLPMDDLRAVQIDAHESFIREPPSSPIIIGHRSAARRHRCC
jgi:hypothetical protein